MADNEDLDPDGREIEVGPLVLRTPGFSGRAALLDEGALASRGPQLASEELSAALAATDVSEKYTVELEGVRRESGDAGGGRGQGEEGEIVLDVPAPAADEGQILMLVEEDGVITWHLPETSDVTAASRDREMVTYRLPARTVDAPVDDVAGTDRGVVSAIGSKVLKILTYPLTPLLKAASAGFAKKWETEHRPARFRTLTSQNYKTADVTELTGADWSRLSQGPALLFVHGTFSSAHTAFCGLPASALDELADHYDGRVFALDHHSVWLPPSENAKLIAAALPKGLPLEVDIVAHSRGGLVARELTERAGAYGIPDSFRVRTLVMAGTPNAGTALAQDANIRKWLDLVTNLAQFLPDNPVTDVIALVLTALKQVTIGAFSGLPGLTSMDPDGEYLKKMNVDATIATTYYAIAAEYEPPVGSALKRVAKDLAIDAVFSDKANDLVVPTAGVATIPNLPRFAPESMVFDKSLGIDHSSFFGNAEVIAKLREWLPG